MIDDLHGDNNSYSFLENPILESLESILVTINKSSEDHDDFHPDNNQKSKRGSGARTKKRKVIPDKVPDKIVSSVPKKRARKQQQSVSEINFEDIPSSGLSILDSLEAMIQNNSFRV
jgi:hypothetical protein